MVPNTNSLNAAQNLQVQQGWSYYHWQMASPRELRATATSTSTTCPRRYHRLLTLLCAGQHSDTALIFFLEKATPDSQQLVLTVMGLILQAAMPTGIMGQ